jgi:hypothetical protein
VSDINNAFCRTMLSLVMADVKKVTTPAERKAAWVYKTDKRSWEFHGPRDFYWYGHADNAADARTQGWSAWLRKYHPEMEAQDDSAAG